ncbi:MAG: hypothetical protein H6Q06_1849, partial [Acidobacteria bacterium]|nr:hypothetical protein [Acidobacteriota bacterium]
LPVTQVMLMGGRQLPGAKGACLETYRVAESGLSTLLDGTNER